MKAKKGRAGHDLDSASQGFAGTTTATQDYTANNSKLTSIQSYIETLKKDPAAAQEALKMFTPNTGKWGAINPLVGQNVKDAAVALQKIQAQLTAEGLSGVKNVRNAGVQYARPGRNGGSTSRCLPTISPRQSTI